MTHARLKTDPSRELEPGMAAHFEALGSMSNTRLARAVESFRRSHTAARRWIPAHQPGSRTLDTQRGKADHAKSGGAASSNFGRGPGSLADSWNRDPDNPHSSLRPRNHLEHSAASRRAHQTSSRDDSMPHHAAAWYWLGFPLTDPRPGPVDPPTGKEQSRAWGQKALPATPTFPAMYRIQQRIAICNPPRRRDYHDGSGWTPLQRKGS